MRWLNVNVQLAMDNYGQTQTDLDRMEGHIQIHLQLHLHCQTVIDKQLSVYIVDVQMTN